MKEKRIVEQTIHYAWVGPPTKTNPLAVAGHDVAAPIQLAERIEKEKKNRTNPIKFWCLKKYAPFYEKQFNEAGVSIDVCPIEDLLEKEAKGEFAEYALFVKKCMQTFLGANDTKGFVQFKDVFSLFLLVCQPGYFFDTNVFPMRDMPINLNGDDCVKTGKSSHTGTNDFYMMYSPLRGDADMKIIFETWKKYPGFGNLGVFNSLYGKHRFLGQRYETDDIYVYIDQDALGVKKSSYKSYQSEDYPGLFFWLPLTYDRDPRLLAENLAYGNVNQQIAYPKSMRLLTDCSLMRINNSPPIGSWLLKLNFPTNEAYIADIKGNIYYVNKKNKEYYLIAEGRLYLKEIFPFSNSVIAPIRAMQEILEAYPSKSKLKSKQPSHIINTKDCTILHDVILNNKIELIRPLLEAGARTDLVATYEIRPSGKKLHMTALELAKYLNYNQIVKEITKVEEEIREKNKVVVQEKIIEVEATKEKSPIEIEVERRIDDEIRSWAKENNANERLKKDLRNLTKEVLEKKLVERREIDRVSGPYDISNFPFKVIDESFVYARNLIEYKIQIMPLMIDKLTEVEKNARKNFLMIDVIIAKEINSIYASLSALDKEVNWPDFRDKLLLVQDKLMGLESEFEEKNTLREKINVPLKELEKILTEEKKFINLKAQPLFETYLEKLAYATTLDQVIAIAKEAAENLANTTSKDGKNKLFGNSTALKKKLDKFIDHYLPMMMNANNNRYGL